MELVFFKKIIVYQSATMQLSERGLRANGVNLSKTIAAAHRV